MASGHACNQRSLVGLLETVSASIGTLALATYAVGYFAELGRARRLGIPIDLGAIHHLTLRGAILPLAVSEAAIDLVADMLLASRIAGVGILAIAILIAAVIIIAKRRQQGTPYWRRVRFQLRRIRMSSVGTGWVTSVLAALGALALSRPAVSAYNLLLDPPEYVLDAAQKRVELQQLEQKLRADAGVSDGDEALATPRKTLATNERVVLSGLSLRERLIFYSSFPRDPQYRRRAVCCVLAIIGLLVFATWAGRAEVVVAGTFIGSGYDVRRRIRSIIVALVLIYSWAHGLVTYGVLLGTTTGDVFEHQCEAHIASRYITLGEAGSRIFAYRLCGAEIWAFDAGHLASYCISRKIRWSCSQDLHGRLDHRGMRADDCSATFEA